MKHKWILIGMLFLALILGACNTDSTTESPDPESYPPPLVSDPVQPPEGGIPYPDMSDGVELPWDPAVSLIFNGDVQKIVIGGELKVFITVTDGRTLVTKQPMEGEIARILEVCGAPCEVIEVESE